jgi:hypothetical protein
VGKLEGKKPHGRSVCRWEDNIKMTVKGREWEGMDWIDVAQQRDSCRAVANTIMKRRVKERTQDYMER